MVAALFPLAHNAEAARKLEQLFTALSRLDAPTHCTLSYDAEPLSAYAARQWVKANAADWSLDIWQTGHGDAMCIVSHKHGFAIVHVYGVPANEVRS